MSSLTKSPACQLKRKQLYKASTPPWKETYRQRCIDRLKSSREKLQEKFRQFPAGDSTQQSFIRDVMKAEWSCLQQEEDKLPRLADQDGDFQFDDDLDNIDTILSIFEEVQRELQLEEQKLFEESSYYEKSLHIDETLLCSAIECLSTNEVMCPICQKYHLMHNRGVIFCQCGMRINTEQDCLTLENVHTQITDGVHSHSLSCPATPTFSVVSDLPGISNMIMTCQSCDWMFVVI